MKMQRLPQAEFVLDFFNYLSGELIMPRCPGQDMRYWKPTDIFEIECFNCGTKIEFWKDEPFRMCRGCGKENRNPRIDLGCAKWCKYADECLGKNAAQPTSPVSPLIDRLELLLEGYFTGKQDKIKIAHRMLGLCEKFTQAGNVDPCVLQAGAVLAGTLFDSDFNTVNFSDFNAMLQRAGIEDSVGQRICRLVASVLSNICDDSEESKALNDIVGLEKINLGRQYTFKTELGRKLASKKI